MLRRLQEGQDLHRRLRLGVRPSGKGCFQIKETKGDPAKTFTIMVCPGPGGPMMGMPCCDWDCMSWIARQIADLAACNGYQGQPGCVAPCMATMPAPPMPMMPPMPPMPPMPCMMPPPPPPVCMTNPPGAARPACAWTLRHTPDAIHISGPCVEGTCESVSYSGQGDSVMLKGHVHLEYGKDGEKAEVSADRVNVSLEDGRLQLNVARSPEKPSPEVMQFLSGFWHY